MVKRMQRYLAWLALYKGEIDGLHGRMTETAIGLLREYEGHNIKVMDVLEERIHDYQLPEYNTPEELADAVYTVCKQMYRSNTVYPAYMMATVEHETAGFFRPIQEGDHLSEQVAKRVRNNLAYKPYWARGLVGITHDYNYEKYGKILGVDLLTHPDRALREDLALFILCHGSIVGTFTGHKIGDYILGNNVDVLQMRRVINGVRRGETLPDCCEKIAKYYERWKKYYDA